MIAEIIIISILAMHLYCITRIHKDVSYIRSLKDNEIKSIKKELKEIKNKIQ